jgi:hypothetical protein
MNVRMSEHSNVGEDSSVVARTLFDLNRDKQCNSMFLLDVRFQISLLDTSYRAYCCVFTNNSCSCGWLLIAQRTRIVEPLCNAYCITFVEKSLAPAGTRTPVPNLSTLLSISHCAD